MKKTKLDKIISGIIFVISIIWFIVQKMTGYFTKIGLEEINQIIPFIAVFSVFCMVWSFVWDQKLERLYKKMHEYETDFSKTNCEVQEDFKKLLIAALSKPPFIESRMLFEYETRLADFLALRGNGGDYAQIYVITNDAKVESENFGIPICENIINNHQYVYITPFEEKKFIEKLRTALFQAKEHSIDKTLLEAAIKKNIRHIQNKELFEILPEYSDIVIYQKKAPVTFCTPNTVIHGFYSFQNGSASDIPGLGCYYYSDMTNERALSIATYIDKLLIERKNNDLSSANFITEKAEIKWSNQCECNGLFCKEKIKKGEVIFKKGGSFILKEDLDKTLLENTMYIQVNTKYVVSSLTVEQNAGFPINHNCRNPNCGFASAIEIVAIKDIEPGKEIFVDYAYFDLDYKRFPCKNCTSCVRENYDKVAIEKELTKESVVKNVSPYLKDYFTGGKT